LKTKGVFVSSILGGLINSIYMSNFFSSNLKKFIVYPFLASVSSMLLRAYILSLIINPGLTTPNIFLLFTAISGFSISYLLSRKNKTTKININLISPISFKFVSFYIPLFSALFLLANIVIRYFGFFASQILAVIVGLIDVSSLATIFSTFDLRNARVLLLILTSSNIIGNSLVIFKSNKKMFFAIFKYFCIIFLLNVFFFLLLS
jgi:hypothetical protein